MIDAVVCNYRTPDDLRDFVASWDDGARGADANLVIVNVDPRSEDFAVAAEVASIPNVEHLAFQANVGYATACNVAASFGHGEVLAFFNADVVLTPGSLVACSSALLERDDVAILGPRQVDDRGRLTHSGIVGTNKAPQQRAWHHPDRSQFRDCVEAVTVSGAAYFIKRAVWEELSDCPVYRRIAPNAAGAFLPTQHYYEETWCSYHARAHGWRCMYFGESTIVHKFHRASPKGGLADQEMPKSRAYFRRACAAHGIECD